MSNLSPRNIVLSFIKDGHRLECHLDVYPPEPGEREHGTGLLLTPPIAAEAEILSVYYQGIDVTFLCSEALQDEICDHAIQQQYAHQ
jgi:hypothetical protein